MFMNYIVNFLGVFWDPGFVSDFNIGNYVNGHFCEPHKLDNLS